MSLNQVTLIGNLGRDPELKYTNSGKAVCNFTIATTERWKDQQGQKQEKTEWHNISVWGNVAENCDKFLSKGSSVCVVGKLQTSSYEKEDHKFYRTEIVAHNVQFLNTKNSEPKNEPTSDNFNSDDIPF